MSKRVFIPRIVSIMKPNKARYSIHLLRIGPFSLFYCKGSNDLYLLVPWEHALSAVQLELYSLYKTGLHISWLFVLFCHATSKVKSVASRYQCKQLQRNASLFNTAY